MATHELVDVTKYPLHVRGDYMRRNRNITEGKTLCDRCSGTGNEFASMYRACRACGGIGVSKGNEKAVAAIHGE